MSEQVLLVRGAIHDSPDSAEGNGDGDAVPGTAFAQDGSVAEKVMQRGQLRDDRGVFDARVVDVCFDDALLAARCPVAFEGARRSGFFGVNGDVCCHGAAIIELLSAASSRVLIAAPGTHTRRLLFRVGD